MNIAFAGDPNDPDNWPRLAALAPGAAALASAADKAGVADPMIRVMNDLGSLLCARAQYASAEPLLRRALAIAEASKGGRHPYLAAALNNMAGLLHATNRLDEAEPLYRRTLVIDEARLGKDHLEVAIDLNNLAEVLRATNRPGEAEPLMRRALAIDEGSRGKDHPIVAIRLNNLALSLHATNRLGEAEPLFRHALAIDEARLGTLGEAWPNFTFEKIDEKRASVVIGMFIDGSLADNIDAVIARIEEADLFRKLIDYVIDRAGLEYRIARAKVAATWLFDQAKPTLDGLKKIAEHHKTALEAQKECEGLVEGQIEVVGSHLQQLNTIYQKHQQIHGAAEID